MINSNPKFNQLLLRLKNGYKHPINIIKTPVKLKTSNSGEGPSYYNLKNGKLEQILRKNDKNILLTINQNKSTITKNIPKIIHQTWKNNIIPIEWRGYVNTWKRNHPDWEYRLWTDQNNRDFIKNHYSWFLKTYDSYNTNIQRVDAIRYFILYHYGGIYADMDMECIRPLDDILKNQSLVLGQEPLIHAEKVFKKNRMLSNALMASCKNHPFWKIVWNIMTNRANNGMKKNWDVLYSTGPQVINDAVQQTSHKYDINITHPDTFFSKVGQGYKQHKINKNVIIYAIHHWSNSWVK